MGYHVTPGVRRASGPLRATSILGFLTVLLLLAAASAPARPVEPVAPQTFHVCADQQLAATTGICP